MSMLASAYVFYADVFLLQNLLIKTTVLFLVVYALKKRVIISITKIFIMAFISSIIEILILYTASNYMLFVVFIYLIEMPMIVFFLFGKNREGLLQEIFYTYFLTVVVNGTLELMWNLFGESASFICVLMLSCLCAVLGVILLFKEKQRRKGVYTVRINHISSKTEVKALYDTGNVLKDPYTGKGVHIVSEKIVDSLQIQEMPKVLIPYQTVGNEADVLEVIYIDEIIIERQKDMIRQQKIPIGIVNEQLFFNKPYEMILNEEVF